MNLNRKYTLKLTIDLDMISAGLWFLKNSMLFAFQDSVLSFKNHDGAVLDCIACYLIYQ